MSNICKTVTLRTRKIKKGTQLSFYLDYYPGYRDESTMKVQRHESLGIYIFAKPKNQRERDYNERMTEKAEVLRCRRYESIVNERYDFFDREKEKGSFLAWFKKKADARNTKWQNVYKHFETFCEGKCTFGEIDVDRATSSRNTFIQLHRPSTRSRGCTPTPLPATGQPSVPCYTQPTVTIKSRRIPMASLTGLTLSLRRRNTSHSRNS